MFLPRLSKVGRGLSAAGTGGQRPGGEIRRVFLPARAAAAEEAPSFEVTLTSSRSRSEVRRPRQGGHDCGDPERASRDQPPSFASRGTQTNLAYVWKKNTPLRPLTSSVLTFDGLASWYSCISVQFWRLIVVAVRGRDINSQRRGSAVTPVLSHVQVKKERSALVQGEKHKTRNTHRELAAPQRLQTFRQVATPPASPYSLSRNAAGSSFSKDEDNSSLMSTTVASSSVEPDRRSMGGDAANSSWRTPRLSRVGETGNPVLEGETQRLEALKRRRFMELQQMLAFQLRSLAREVSERHVARDNCDVLRCGHLLLKTEHLRGPCKLACRSSVVGLYSRQD